MMNCLRKMADKSRSFKRSMVPLMFHDWWDDFDRPSRLMDQHFGMGLRRDDLFSSYPSAISALSPLLLSAGYIRPWRQLGLQNSGFSNITADKDKFQVKLDVQQFTPDEITVKTVDNAVIVEAKHEQLQDEHGYVARHFMRRYLLPRDAQITDVKSALSSDGVLTVTAETKPSLASGERVVPIVQTGVPELKSDKEQHPQVEQPKEEQQPQVEQPKEGQKRQVEQSK